ncbi:CGNR zinc finger domain-containing protein [Actinomadura parmotrematis]|uniref:ABATE domain-containing protein n=1 Tax=Actinomadura parmotrematis TaxID=2864039 RepID=A0ABS7G0G8_9ACTN|nr:ABATE domain-containing protein [Actinomadura parmotrematis]MBW8485322.1 ABATE domain-containing protein [Actinomadura parmotrematis]
MEFTFVSGNLGLDLAGTVGARRSRRIDLLAGPADLARWTVDARLLDTAPEVTAAGLADARRLREAIYGLATAARTAAPYAPGDLDVLNRAAEPAPPAVRLTPDGLVRTGDLAAALAAAARAAADLLGGPQTALVRECEADPCTRLFVDASHRRTRRWCDMRGCGNRAKAAAFRARHA